MKIQVTEGKTDRPEFNENVARVFFQGHVADNGYGFFIPEHLVFAQLSHSQRLNYSELDRFVIDDAIVEELQEAGFTYPPKSKTK